MPKSNHKYRTTIYLGKDIYEELEKLSKVLNLGISSLAGIMFKTGWEMSKIIDKQEEATKQATDFAMEVIKNVK